MEEVGSKEDIIEVIKELIATSKEDKVDINPDFLEYFEIEELISIRDKLIIKKSNIRETTFEYLDELYEKTKEDSI